MHLSAVAPLHSSHPAGQAVMAEVSKKNFGAASRHSAKEDPKHKTQF